MGRPTRTLAGRGRFVRASAVSIDTHMSVWREGEEGGSARKKNLSERPMAAASARWSSAAKKKQGSGLCSTQCGHQSGQLKTPTQTFRNQSKLPFLAPFSHKTSSSPFQSRTTDNSAKFYTNHTKPQQKPIKSQKCGILLATNRPIAGPPNGRCLAGCGHSAVRSREQKRTPHLRAAKTAGMAAGR